jgi:hypothetical protein
MAGTYKKWAADLPILPDAERFPKAFLAYARMG